MAQESAGKGGRGGDGKRRGDGTHCVVEQIVDGGGRALLRMNIVRFHSKFTVAILAPAEDVAGNHSARVFVATTHAADFHAVKIRYARWFVLVAVATDAKTTISPLAPRKNPAVVAQSNRVEGTAGYGSNGGQARHQNRRFG